MRFHIILAYYYQHKCVQKLDKLEQPTTAKKLNDKTNSIRVLTTTL